MFVLANQSRVRLLRRLHPIRILRAMIVRMIFNRVRIRAQNIIIRRAITIANCYSLMLVLLLFGWFLFALSVLFGFSSSAVI